MSALLLVAVLSAAPAEAAAPAARPAPEWLRRGVMYQIWLRSFTPEGTLAAAAARLPQIADLGATIVYLPPVMLSDDDTRRDYWSPRQRQSPAKNPRNPYRMADFNRIDPEYGSEADLRAFVAAAHRHKLRVLLDLVYHHVGPKWVLVDRPGFVLRHPDGRPQTNAWNFVRLNLANNDLREHLYENMLRWVREFDVDGFRCDVSGAVPLDFWEEARRRAEALRPDVVVLAEDSGRGLDQRAAFDVNYSFPWYNALAAVAGRGQPATELTTAWTKLHDKFLPGSRFIRYSDNHDLHRADVVFSERGADAVAVLNFALDGVPMLYNGQEIADATPQDLFSHWPIRWEATTLPKQQAKLAFYQRLCRMRTAEATLAAGDVRWLTHNRPESVVAFQRVAGDEAILAVVNLGNRALDVAVELKGPATYASLLGDQTVTVDGKASLSLGGFGYFVGKRKAGG